MDTKTFQKFLEHFECITPLQREKLLRYGSLLQEKNKTLNLISRKDIVNVYEHHILHSLSVLYFFKFSPQQIILDIGSGGGIPGIPLAIIFPQSTFILTDCIGKKVNAITAFCDVLALENIIPKKTNVSQLDLDKKVDTVIARAVAPLDALVQYSKHLLHPQRNYPTSGYLFFKGGDLQSERKSCKLNFKLFDIAQKIPSISYYQEKYLLYAR